ncbi:MalY/PatB family protein [Halomonas binhaiensis]|uniref:cysteine-S-conjugate beta-lyase n=1 Tax=Halomonas binhaiensis TaxID=2562282 RepID=A0A5C1NKY1_9GAMM|nr:PatB family C-S lyase [Halomonas binhaiensis]QEM83341.1 PatB family C-S lyase [Halomonas binhaiensis]
MKFDFATPVDRRQPHHHIESLDTERVRPQWPSQKWHTYADDILPLWVADMDFRSPPAVIEAIQQRVAHGVFGYGLVPESLRQALCDWSVSHYGWEIQQDWQHWLPGVVPALHLASLAFTEPGDGVLTVAPIYPPFLQVARHTGRLPQTVDLQSPGEDEGWSLDLDALEAAITDETRLLLWCHPHNPTGRQWTHEELAGLAALVERHDLIVVSDELHCDLLLDEGAQHRALAEVFPGLAERSVTLWAPSKTFNLAGLTAACAVIPNASFRKRFRDVAKGLMPDANVLGLVAAEAAYRHGEPWRQELLQVLRGHRRLLAERVARWPGVGFKAPQSTYLAWLDLRQSRLGNESSPAIALLDRAGVALSDGAAFGYPGFVRLNFGTTAEQLEQALERMDNLLA